MPKHFRFFQIFGFAMGIASLAPQLSLRAAEISDTDAKIVNETAFKLYSEYYGVKGFSHGPPVIGIKSLILRLSGELTVAEELSKKHIPVAQEYFDEKKMAAQIDALAARVREEEKNIPPVTASSLEDRKGLTKSAGFLFRSRLSHSYYILIGANESQPDFSPVAALTKIKCAECAVIEILDKEQKDHPIGAVVPAPKQPHELTKFERTFNPALSRLGFAIDSFRRLYLATLATRLSLDHLPPRFEKIQTSSGQFLGWPGKTEEGDYFPTLQNSFLTYLERYPPLEVASTTKGRFEKHSSIRGGFRKHPDFYFSFATASESVLPARIFELIGRHDGVISRHPKLRRSLDAVLRDPGVFGIATEFLMSGGQLGFQRGGGKYFPAPLTVGGGIDGDEIETQGTIIHELLHFVMDRYDSHLWEAGGAYDHVFIYRWVERWTILAALREGRSPWMSRIMPLSQFINSAQDSLFSQVERAFKANILEELLRLSISDEVYSAYVGRGVAEILQLKFAASSCTPSGSCGYEYTDAEVKDLAFLHAFNAQLLQQSLRLAIHFSRSKGSVESSYGDPQFLRAFEVFLTRWVERLSAGNEGVRQSAIEEMNGVIQTVQ